MGGSQAGVQGLMIDFGCDFDAVVWLFVLLYCACVKLVVSLLT